MKYPTQRMRQKQFDATQDDKKFFAYAILFLEIYIVFAAVAEAIR